MLNIAQTVRSAGCAACLAALLTSGAAGSEAPRPKLLLLTANASDPDRNFVTFTLAWLARRGGMEYDAYYAADRGDGGIFSPHGSAMVGGRHDTAVAYALARFDTTVVRLNDCSVFEPLIRAGARSVVSARSGALVDLYQRIAGTEFPKVAVAIQTRDLPAALHSIQPYLFPEVVHRQAVAVPLELDAPAIARLKRLGVREVFTIASPAAPLGPWRDAGYKVQPADELAAGDTLFGVTSRIVTRWKVRARGIDLCEPVLASYWVPFSVRESRLQICSAPTTKESVEFLEKTLGGKGAQVIYGRYAGGEVKGVGDLGLWPLFRKNLSVQVAEPGRPVLTVLAARPAPLAQPVKPWPALEPGDAALREWARQGKILATWVLHSGELSHDDVVVNFVEFSALRNIPIGMGAHWQRFAFEPWSVEAAQVPREQCGALGLVEPVLHSAGDGIIAEKEADPNVLAAAMKRNRDRIAALVGEGSAPRGVYCYLDANLADWDEPAEPLWKAIRSQGFEYVISAVSSGPNRILYRDGGFVVLNLVGRRAKTSPFVSFRTTELEDAEKELAAARKPGWLIGVLDIPLYAYNSFLPVGHRWGFFKRISDLYEYMEKGARERNLVPATPHTVARYARILDEMKLLEP